MKTITSFWAGIGRQVEVPDDYEPMPPLEREPGATLWFKGLGSARPASRRARVAPPRPRRTPRRPAARL
jgi:hypothetical protein